MTVSLFATAVFARSPIGAQTECGNFACPRNYQPICGSNGQTYGNECIFNQAKCASASLEVEHFGECEKKCEFKFCSREFRPVCGSNGVTYPTLCILENEKCENPELEVVHQGECQAKEEKECVPLCSREFQPICGSDGVVHSNPCMFEYADCLSEKHLEIMPSEYCNGQARLEEIVNLKSGKNKRKNCRKGKHC